MIRRTLSAQMPAPSSRIDVDGDAIAQNLRGLRQAMAPSRLVMVVKAHAYGHGYHTAIPAAAQEGVRDFAVFSAHEAAHVLQQAPADARIQVMGHRRPRDLPFLAKNGIEVWLNGPDDVHHLKELKTADPLRVHVEVETGMNRTGLHPDAAVQAAMTVAEHPSLELVGLCTHLAGAEDPHNDKRIAQQVDRFNDVRRRLDDMGLAPACHVASSSAALRWPHLRMDMVRIGIAAYGLWPTPFVQQEANAQGPAIQLRQALTWRSRILAQKDVPQGQNVGYGAVFTTAQSMRIGIVPVGYGDGFSRLMSMQGHVLVGGRRCPIVGQVNMNMVQVDLTGVDAGAEEEVVLVGHQGDQRIGIHSFAEMNEVVDYEFMARLSWDVPRSLVRSQPAPAAGSTSGVR